VDLPLVAILERVDSKGVLLGPVLGTLRKEELLRDRALEIFATSETRNSETKTFY